MLYVQFTDKTEENILSIFAGPQSPEAYPNLGEVKDEKDERIIAFLGAQAKSTEQNWRDNQLRLLTAMRNRHKDQLEIEAETTLSDDEYKSLLHYMQALRDWSKSEYFPDTSKRPEVEDWLTTALLSPL